MSHSGHLQSDQPEFPLNDKRIWHHLVLTTYGAWLYGDERGFRTRHHREHVEGDYKHPPPAEQYEQTRRQSQKTLKQQPVNLPSALRPVVGVALKTRFEELGAFVLAIAVSSQHIHIQAKIDDGEARRWTGIAKRHAWFVLREQGWKSKLWGKRSRAVPIRDRKHQGNVYRYILAHETEGAWVWKWSNDR